MNIQATAQEARNKFAEILNIAVYSKKNVVITRFNKPMAVLVDYKEYERLINPRLQYTEEEWEKGFSVFDRIRTKTKDIPIKQIQQTTKEALRSIRRENRAQSRH